MIKSMIKFADNLGFTEGKHSVAITGNREAGDGWLQSYYNGLAHNKSA